MQLDINGEIEINGIKLEISELIIDNQDVHTYATWSKNNIEDIKLLKHKGITIIKNGKLVMQCNNDCIECPMCESTELHIYTQPNTFRISNGYRCADKGTYSESIEALSSSKIKSKHDIELKKAYELIDKEFNRKRTKFVTNETLKVIISNIDDALTPNMCEHYDEYGHVRIELETIEISKNKYGYTMWYHGRMGDYGLSSTVYLNKKCDVEEIANALRNKYYKKYRTSIKVVK